MTKKFLFMLLGAATIVSCNKLDLDIDGARQAEEAKEAQEVKKNAEDIFGKIDPKQDWNSINSGTVSVTANANLSDIVKVQILTESPLLNTDAKVLAEATATNGQTVTLNYDAPNVYEQLIAACINNKGVYHIQVFDVNQSSVKFSNTTASATPRRASASEAPTITSIKLKAPQKSFNTLRTEAGDNCIIKDDKGNEIKYTVWMNSGWSDEMWEPADGQAFDNGWHMDTDKNKAAIFRDLTTGFPEGEEARVKKFINDYTYKYSSGKKKNNITNVRNSKYFKQNSNYVYSNGADPITLIPIQAYTDEFKMNHIFYYYYKTSEIPAGMDEVAYIKTLPKYKAIQIERIQDGADSKSGKLFHNKEFLLPYYTNAPKEDENEASAIFPPGYKIGFLNMKHENGKYQIDNCKYGCVYGDGRLNYEVNHIKGHYLSAMDKSIGGLVDGGMTWTDPRIAMFTVNDKTYMCFEEGADCNFSDMVFEISGAEMVQETPEPEVQVHTMCFEDRPNTADYDLNDVVLHCTRVNATTLTLTLAATGANDDVVIHGATGWKYNDTEVHAAFGATEADENGNRFINTVKGGVTMNPVSANVTVPEGLSIPDFLAGIFIVNNTTGKLIKKAVAGDPPYAIIVPGIFKYPLERVCINNAYLKFKSWAQDMTSDKSWYTDFVKDKVYE